MNTTVDSKLADWVDLYDQLSDARSRLKKAPNSPELNDDVRRLTRLAGAALDQISQDYASIKQESVSPSQRAR